MNLEPFKTKSIADQAWDAAWDYVSAIGSRDEMWIGYTSGNARRAARHYPKEFAANCRLALSVIGRNLRKDKP
jgi:hypothetical protein